MKKLFLFLTVSLILGSSSVQSQEKGSTFPGAGGQDNCPGGSCTFTKYRLDGTMDWSCSACAQQGQTPRCNTGGCDTW